MEDKPHVAARRAILAIEIEANGLANVARKAGKPDRQINDMAAGRKAFGDRIARDIEPLLRADLPAGWLVFATPETAAAHTTRRYPTSDAPIQRVSAQEPTPASPDPQAYLADLAAQARDLADEAHHLAGLIMQLHPDQRAALKAQILRQTETVATPGGGTLIGTTRKAPTQNRRSGP